MEWIPDLLTAVPAGAERNRRGGGECHSRICEFEHIATAVGRAVGGCLSFRTEEIRCSSPITYPIAGILMTISGSFPITSNPRQPIDNRTGPAAAPAKPAAPPVASKVDADGDNDGSTLGTRIDVKA